MTQAIQKKQDSPLATLRNMLESKPMLGEIQKALPNGWTPQKFVRVALTAAQKNPRIAECTAISVAGALMECAQLGLEPDPTLGHAYLVPFKTTCTMIPGYRGYVSLALRSGAIDGIWSEVVREGDEFQVMHGTMHQIHHVVKYPRSTKQSDWTGTYACVRYKDGYVDFEYLHRDEVLAIKKRSPSVRSGMPSPWDTDEEAMWKKTAIRRLAKRLDLSPEDKRLSKMAVLDEYRDAGVARKVGLGVDDYEFGQTGDIGALPGPVERADAPDAAAPGHGAPQTADQAADGVDTGGRPEKSPKSPQNAKSAPKPTGKPITENQRLDLFRAAADIMDGGSVNDFVLKMVAKHGFKKSGDVTTDKYDALLAEIKAGGFPS